MRPIKVGFVSLLAIVAPCAVCSDIWRPVAPEELALKEPKVDKDADGEALFWDVRVKDELRGEQAYQTRTNYIRIKIFKAHGKETLGTVNLEYLNNVSISEIAGRTIRADGTVAQLTKDAIFERTSLKGRHIKIQQTSFAMPNVEVGAIIEYRWKELHARSRLADLPLQREIPIEELIYHVKLQSDMDNTYRMRGFVFNCANPGFVQEADGFSRVSWTDVPAFHSEPEMPPESEVKRWMLLYYVPDGIFTSSRFWNEVGSQIYEESRKEIKASGDVRQLAQSIVSGAKNDDEKLGLILKYCQTKLRNTLSDDVTLQEREFATRNHKSSDTLKRGIGSSYDIALAFMALAIAADYDARIACLSNRGEYFSHSSLLTTHFLNGYDVAVRLNGEWRFYDPANPNLPPGELRWQEEGVSALITDAQTSDFFKTPLTPPDRSKWTRMAILQLDEEGSISGTVRETLGGQLGLEWRESLGKATSDEREDELKKGIHARLPESEISDVVFDMPANGATPIMIAYRIKVSGYAQKTGKRLFIAPGFFGAGKEARFPTGARRFPVYFHFPWSEVDRVEIALPQGYELDHADAPRPAVFDPVGSDTVSIHFNPKSNTLTYDRQFVFGKNGVLVFPVEAYPTLKSVFDDVHRIDTHLLTLKQSSISNQSSSDH